MNDAGIPAPVLARRCDPGEIPYETTDDIRADDGVVGQARAERALAFALDARHEDCNVFVMGPPGIGKLALVRASLARHAASTQPASDWVYVNNFASPHEPTAIELPAGRGADLRRDIERLIRELERVIPAIFDSEEYAQRAEKIQAEFNERRDAAVAEVGAEAQAQGVSLMRTPAGYVFLPSKEGEVVSPSDFANLPQEERDRFSAAITALQERLEKVIRDTLRARKESAERIAQLNREMVMLAIGQPVEELVRRYAEWPKVVEYLHAVQRDALENADSFQRAGEADEMPVSEAAADLRMRRYRVNVLVDRSAATNTEVLFCDHPTYTNLVGHSDHVQHLGTLMTDFTLLKPGALHRANGGYLVIDALKLLTQPFSWEALKRALSRREIRIEPVAELWGVAPAAALEPEPIPLRVRVVLLGERRLYYLLQALDPDFTRLFKVVADFDDVLERSPQCVAGYARLVAGIAQRDALLPFERTAVARLVDEASRHAGDARKLSGDRALLERLMREADFAARRASRPRVGPRDVEEAIDAHRLRSSRLKSRVQEAIERGVVMIDTSGERIGQVNALAFIDVGEVPFAMPARVTATARPGEGAVVDIQREARLGGAVHSKGVLILTQFLAARYSAHRPHCLAASIAFEQTYGEVEGDSASLAELCALLSALAGVPVRQSVALTGSVNQAGDVQAVGGVNEKIEGFFEVCRQRGLDGRHGVIIPAANLQHLMLDAPVVDAARQGLFHVWPVTTVDEALERLTGMPAGSADAFGAGEDTVNARVARRLREFGHARVALAPGAAAASRLRSRRPSPR